MPLNELSEPFLIPPMTCSFTEYLTFLDGITVHKKILQVRRKKNSVSLFHWISLSLESLNSTFWSFMSYQLTRSISGIP